MVFVHYSNIILKIISDGANNNVFPLLSLKLNKSARSLHARDSSRFYINNQIFDRTKLRRVIH